MAANSHLEPHHERYVHESEDTSDSNEEFASASEGDDDLPWEPVVIRSPVVSRQIHRSPEPESSPQALHTATVVPEQEYYKQEQQEEQLSLKPAPQQQEQQHTQRPPFNQEQQQQQQQQLQHHEGHIHYQQSQWHHTSDSTLNVTTTSSSSWSSYSQHSQHHAIQHASPSTSMSTRTQTNSVQTRSRSTPKLRERMRQSPVLHSRIVQAYLDPNASSAHRQQAAPDFVQKAWLQEHQDAQQESSEDDQDDKEILSDQRVPSLTPVQSYPQPMPVLASVPDLATSRRIPLAPSQTDHIEADDAWGFDERIGVDDAPQEGQIEASWGFDEPATVQEVFSEATLDAVQKFSELSENTSYPHIHQVHEINVDDDDAWGYDDQVVDLVEADIQEAPQALPAEPEKVHYADQYDSHEQQQQGDHTTEYMNVEAHGDHREHDHDHEQVIEAGENIHEDKNPFRSPEDDLYPERSSCTDPHSCVTHTDNSESNIQLAAAAYTEHLDEADPDATWHQEGGVGPVNEEVLEDAVEESAPEAVVASQSNSHDSIQRHCVVKEAISMGSDVDEAEASWGFDIDEVVDIETPPVAENLSRRLDLPDDAGLSRQLDLLDNVSLAVENYEHHVGLVQADLHTDFLQHQSQAEGPHSEDVIADIACDSVIPEKQIHTMHESDSEHDSEVREILQATVQYNPFVGSKDGLQIGQASKSSSSTVRDNVTGVSNDESGEFEYRESSMEDHHDESFHHSIPVKSHLSIMQDTTPESNESASQVVAHEDPGLAQSTPDVRDTISDSEGSDIYGDLSTARSGINASSNRLNEILEDDDYLEHMERGVPMNRSISTPYSDDDSPKFIVEDEVVELMERGEPRDTAAVSRDFLEDTYETSEDASLFAHGIELSSSNSSFNLALNIPAVGAESVKTDAVVLDAQDSFQSADSMGLKADEPVDVDMLEPSTLATIQQEPVEATKAAQEAFIAPSTSENACLADSADVEASDDHDPANPFSDAAAVADDNQWLAAEQRELKGLQVEVSPDQEKAGDLKLLAEAVSVQDAHADHIDAESTLQKENIEEHAWADQDLNIVVEPVNNDHAPVHPDDLIWTKPATAEPAASIHDSVEDETVLDEPKPEHENAAAKQDDAGGDAWDDGTSIIVDNLSSATDRLDVDLVHNFVSGELHEQRQDSIDEFQRQYPTLVNFDMSENRPCERPRAEGEGVSNAVDAILDENHAWADSDENTISNAVLPDTCAAEGDVPKEEDSMEVTADFDVHRASHAIRQDSHIYPCTGESAVDSTAEAKVSSTGDAQAEEHAWISQVDDAVVVADSSTKSYDPGMLPATAMSHRDDGLAQVQASVDINKALDDWNEEDAWNDQDDDLVDITSKMQQQTTSPTIDEGLDEICFQPPASVLFALHEPSAPIVDFDLEKSIESALHEDTRNEDVSVFANKEALAASIHDSGLHVADIQATLEKSVALEFGDRISTEREVDLWADHNIDLTIHDSVLTSTELAAGEIKAEVKEGQDPDNHPQASILAARETCVDGESQVQYESTLLISESEARVKHLLELSNVQLVNETFLESALEEDAWADQDDNIELEPVDTTLTSTVQTVQLDDRHDGHLIEPQEDVPEQGNYSMSQTGIHPPTSRIGSLIHQIPSDQPEEVAEDTWGWDEDEVGVHLEIQKETPPSRTEESSAFAAVASDFELRTLDDSLPEPKPEVLSDAGDQSEPATGNAIGAQKTSLHPLLPAHAASDVGDSLSPFAVQNECVASGTDSGEGDEDSAHANQSPWQDVSPASVSKRSEAGMSIGSEFESEYSVRSLEDDEHTSPMHSATKTAAESSMSWTSLRHDEWQSDTPYSGSSTDLLSKDKDEQPNTFEEPQTKESQPALEIQDLPDITGADSWDFDHDEHPPTSEESPKEEQQPAVEIQDLPDISGAESWDFDQDERANTSEELLTKEQHAAVQIQDLPDISGADSWDFDQDEHPNKSDEPQIKEQHPAVEIQDLPDISGADSWDLDQDGSDELKRDMMSIKKEQVPVSARARVSRDLMTPDMQEHPSHAQLHSLKQSTSLVGSMTSSPERTESHHSSAPGSLPASPHQPQSASSVHSIAAEMEDDSHLPLAIRQQRARLAARGKPLPPISKYKSTKDITSAADRTLSPRLSAATSPVVAFLSPITSPVSPMLTAASTTTPVVSPSSTVSDVKYLSPALQKQRERLEQKRAAAAAAAAAPLSAARRMTVTEPSKDLTSQLHAKPTSPLLSPTALPSALRMPGSPTLAKKTVQLPGTAKSLSSAASALSASSTAEDSGLVSSRRRGSSAAAPVPTSPLAEGFVRRSKDGSRPNVKSTTSYTAEAAVRTSQSDAHRQISRLSMSSVTSGWDDTTEEEDVNKGAEDIHGLKSSKSTTSRDRKESPSALFSSTSSHSFYQQTVPGLDEDSYGMNTSKTTTDSTMIIPTSYLNSKKADDYDPYGPKARKSAKSKSSFEDSMGSSRVGEDENETMIGGSSSSPLPNISLKSSASAASMSHRHDHHGHGNSTSNSGFFSGSSNSLVGDISNILKEKSVSGNNPPGTGRNYERDNKKPSSSSSSSSTSNLQKSSSWSFGSWVSSAVAVASEKIDKAYESLDPEYSRMKSRGGNDGGGSLSPMDDGSQDPESMSPYKKPGYVVGGSSLALGLASISTGPSSAPLQQQQQQQHRHASPPISGGPALGFGSSSGDSGYALLGSSSDSHPRHVSHALEQRLPDWEREQSVSPRLTRKNVSGR
ncbi:hypothetical protein BGX28_008346 [Mortierella sp. GBA30]|nr:hypothetical protein BGX28_008346 [Mortierella sp. GBA30]